MALESSCGGSWELHRLSRWIRDLPSDTWQEAWKVSMESFKETIVLVTAGFQGSGTVGLSADSLQLQGGLSNSNCFLNQEFRVFQELDTKH